MAISSEQRLKQILSSSPVITYTCGVDGDYELTFVSDNVTSRLGYSVEECLRWKNFWREVVHPEDHSHVFTDCDAFFETGREAHEYRFLKKDGTYLWILDEMNLVRDAKGQPLEIVGSWLDISDRKATEESLTQSESLFKVLFDSNPIPTIITSMKGIVRRVNPAFTKVTGFTEQEVIGRTSVEIGFWRSAEDRERVASLILEQGGIDNQILNFYGKDNAPMVCLTSSRQTIIDGENLFLNTVIDITEQRSLEEQLQKSEALFKVFFDTNPIPTIISTVDGTVEEVNDAFLQSSGFKREEVEGQNSTDLFWKDLADREHMVKAIKNHGALDNYQCVFYDKERTPRTCILSCRAIEKGQQLRILNTIVDISEQHEAQEAQRKSELLFRALFDISPMGAIVTAPDGIIHLVNPAFVAASGYTSEEMVGHNVYDLGFWKDPDLRSQMLTELRQRGFIDDLEAVMYAKNKKAMTCLISSRAISYEGETRILNVVADVTEKRAAESAMRRLEKAKSDFISTAAHELRTPLIAIVGYCELLENAAAMNLDDSQKEEFLGVIQNNAEILNRLVDDLLDIGRIQIGRSLGVQPVNADLKAVIEKVIASFKLKNGHHEIVVDSEDGFPETLSFDVSRITQVMHNLLGNAIKYSPSGGILKIVLRKHDDKVEVSVVDRGIGMSPDQIEHVFDRFYRAEETSEAVGLGLGMSIVKQIILDHGGDITVVSSPGKGTTVAFELPL